MRSAQMGTVVLKCCRDAAETCLRRPCTSAADLLLAAESSWGVNACSSWACLCRHAGDACAQAGLSAQALHICRDALIHTSGRGAYRHA